MLGAMGEPERWIVGCMTGTSLDGLDAALVHVAGQGEACRASFHGHVHHALPETLQQTLLALASDEPARPATFAAAARALGEAHLPAAAALLERHLPSRARLHAVAAHGQTIHHAPAEGLSWQLLDPWPIVHAWRKPVVYDFRQADLLAGGAGAPITPAADRVLFGETTELVCNLGGVCNVTDLSSTPVAGWDQMPCNLLLNGLACRLLGRAFDEGGRIAARGRERPELRRLLAEAIDRAMAGRRTLGREQFGEAFFAGLMPELTGWPVEDVLASATAELADRLTAVASRRRVRRVVLAGGGTRHRALIAALAARGGQQAWRVSDEVGLPAEAREAAAMAVLAALSEDGVAVTGPAATESQAPVPAGTWAGLSFRG